MIAAQKIPVECESWSPEWIRTQGNGITRRAIAAVCGLLTANTVARNALFLLLIFEGLIGWRYFGTIQNMLSNSYGLFGWVSIFLLRFLHIFPALLLVAPVNFFIKNNSHRIGLFFILFVCFTAGGSKIIFGSAEIRLVYLAAFCLPLLAVIFGNSFSLTARLMAVSLALIVTSALFVHSLVANPNEKFIAFLGNDMMHIFAFFSLLALMIGRVPGLHSIRSLLLWAFQPGHLIGPYPVIPNSSKMEEPIQPIVKGIYDLHLALLLFFCLGAVPAVCNLFSWHSEILVIRILAEGTQKYIQFYFGAWLTLLLASGSLRLMGFSIHDPFDWPLLASSPIERWRRWTIYHYEWCMALVYLPLQRMFRSGFLSIMVVFLITYLMHAYFYAIIFFLKKLDFNAIVISPKMGAYVKDELVFYILNGLAVYVCFRFPKLIMDERKKSAWIGVIATFVIMSFIHWRATFY